MHFCPLSPQQRRRLFAPTLIQFFTRAPAREASGMTHDT